MPSLTPRIDNLETGKRDILNHPTDGTEYTVPGYTINEEQVYARTWRFLVNYAAAGATTIDTIDTGLIPLNALKITTTIFSLAVGNYIDSSTDRSYMRYDTSSGIVDVFSTNRTVYADTTITMMYLKP